MQADVTPREAHAALETIERRRLRDLVEIDLPTWYLGGRAAGWFWAPPTTPTGSGFAFGTVHASVAPRIVSGRRRSGSLTVRADVAPPHVARLVIGALIALGAVTVAGALVLDADGAGHPTTIASVFVALIIVLGGPRLLSRVRRSAARSASAS